MFRCPFPFKRHAEFHSPSEILEKQRFAKVLTPDTWTRPLES
jgi:hypothetical protein